MQRLEVEQVFEENKAFLLEGYLPDKNPIAIILGGQPAAGKSQLAVRAKENHATINFLTVNGDLYRAYHPEHENLIKTDPLSYPSETQIFSNVFTEKLIQEAKNNKFNIIVEGTMRNPDIPLSTAKTFKDAGFQVEAYIIAAPAEFTEIGTYIRYQQEVQATGSGRLADINSHNEAVENLPLSADRLFQAHAVDKIVIYSYLTQEKVREYTLIKNLWDCTLSPADTIKQSRENQLKNESLTLEILNKGKITLNKIKGAKIRKDLQKALNKLMS